MLRMAKRWVGRKGPGEAEATGKKLGAWVYKVSKKRRERCLANLQLAFPELSDSERDGLCQRVFEHYGIVTADFLNADRRTLEDVKGSMEVEGYHHMVEALDLGRGVILITGHFGNWERMSAYVSGLGHKLTVVARDTRNERLNQMVNELRSKGGTEVIPRGNAARPILERLRKNEIVGILPDQNSAEVFVPFFGHLCGTVLGPGVLSERTGAPVMPVYCVRIGTNQYRMTFEPPLTPAEWDGPKGSGMMVAIHRSLEARIRAHPEQWLWFHDRWRSARQRGYLTLPES